MTVWTQDDFLGTGNLTSSRPEPSVVWSRLDGSTDNVPADYTLTGSGGMYTAAGAFDWGELVTTNVPSGLTDVSLSITFTLGTNADTVEFDLLYGDGWDGLPDCIDAYLYQTGASTTWGAAVYSSNLPNPGVEPLPWAVSLETQHTFALEVVENRTKFRVRVDGAEILNSGTLDHTLPLPPITGMAMKDQIRGPSGQWVMNQWLGSYLNQERSYFIKDDLISIGGNQWLIDRIPEIGGHYFVTNGSVYTELVVNEALSRESNGVGTAYWYSNTTLPSEFIIEFKMQRKSSAGNLGEFTIARSGLSFGNSDKFFVLDWQNSSSTLYGGASTSTNVDLSSVLVLDDHEYTFKIAIVTVPGATVFTYYVDDAIVLLAATPEEDWFTGFLGFGLYSTDTLPSLWMNDLAVFKMIDVVPPSSVIPLLIPPPTMTVQGPTPAFPNPSIKPSYVVIPVTVQVTDMLTMAVRAWGSEYSAPDHNVYMFSNGRGWDSTDLSKNGIYGVVGDSAPYDTILIDDNYPDMQTELLTDNVSVSSPPGVTSTAQGDPTTWTDVYELFAQQ